MEAWITEGRVRPGIGLARGLGCPTANLVLENNVDTPDPGVYAAYASWDAEHAPALVCIHPPNPRGEVKIETHVLERDVDLREKDVRLEVHAKLRNFVPWTDETAMCALIQNDLQHAIQWFHDLAHMDANRYSSIDGSPFRFTIVRARFNEEVTQGLLDACIETLRVAGVRSENISIIEVPGSMEIGYVLNACAREGTTDVLIVLGAVIKGETAHFEYVASFCMDSIREVVLTQRIPVSVGVLTCFNRAQAEARSGSGPLNRGREAALAAIEMAALRRNMGWTRAM